jgi:cytochrome o ubiquinol oxidase operon protein cyoD
MHLDNLKSVQKEWKGSLKAYLIGFCASLFLTLISFGLVAFKLISTPILFYLIIGLALLQAIIQLLFFLHLGQEPKPQWETLVFYFMLLTLLIVVLGSLWIMYDLDDRVMRM